MKDEFRLDRIFREVKELVPVEGVELLTPSVVQGVVPQATLDMRPQQAFRDGYSVAPAQPNDFVISLSSHAHGIEWCGIHGGISPDYTLLRPIVDIRYSRYLKYALKSQYIISQLGVFKTGIRMGLRLQWNKVRYCKIQLPPVEVAERLADHLDRTTARIDSLIARKTRFIELLREKRQALIGHAATKGLDSTVPMKDSGVEWLGEVPSTWDVVPLRVFLTLRRDIVRTASANTKLLSLTTRGVIERDLENPTGKMPASFDTYQRVSAGDMVFCLFDIDETPRTVGISPQEGMITGAYTVFRPSSELSARFLYYFFLHVDEYKRLKPFYKGLRKTIRSGPFLSIQVPRPPEAIAADIVAHLDRDTTRIDTLIAKTERSIELLREHRTALITAAVTGKIDLAKPRKGHA